MRLARLVLRAAQDVLAAAADAAALDCLLAMALVAAEQEWRRPKVKEFL